MNKYGIEKTTKEVMLDVAANIRAIRKEQKMTQKALSKKSGVAYASVMKFETTGIISFESLLKLCNAIGRLQEFGTILKPSDIQRKEDLFNL